MIARGEVIAVGAVGPGMARAITSSEQEVMDRMSRWIGSTLCILDRRSNYRLDPRPRCSSRRDLNPQRTRPALAEPSLQVPRRSRNRERG